MTTLGHYSIFSWQKHWINPQLKHLVKQDDKVLAQDRPWSGGWNIPWQTVNYDNSAGGKIHEYFCHGNERDSEHFNEQEGRR